jgi:hypothetical protein
MVAYLVLLDLSKLLVTERGCHQCRHLNNIVGVVGPSDVEVNCSYVRDPGDVLFLISLKAFSEGTYNTIATFLPTNAFPPAFTPGGQYLEYRANLTNPTGGTNTATISPLCGISMTTKYITSSPLTRRDSFKNILIFKMFDVATRYNIM